MNRQSRRSASERQPPAGIARERETRADGAHPLNRGPRSALFGPGCAVPAWNHAMRAGGGARFAPLRGAMRAGGPALRGSRGFCHRLLTAPGSASRRGFVLDALSRKIASSAATDSQAGSPPGPDFRRPLGNDLAEHSVQRDSTSPGLGAHRLKIVGDNGERGPSLHGRVILASASDVIQNTDTWGVRCQWTLTAAIPASSEARHRNYQRSVIREPWVRGAAIELGAPASGRHRGHRPRNARLHRFPWRDPSRD